MARLLIDFGLVILIWMVQLIVYPSFLHYTRENLMRWHRRYTPAIGYIVGPLMLGQLGLALYQTGTDFTFFRTANLLMVIGLWLITYFQFVPRHQAISKGLFDATLLISLVTKNWSRTLFWTLVFLDSLRTVIV